MRISLLLFLLSIIILIIAGLLFVLGHGGLGEKFFSFVLLFLVGGVVVYIKEIIHD